MDDSKTALIHLAAKSCSPEVIGMLAKNGADLNSPGGDMGMSPVHIAAMVGNYHVIPALKTHGANFLAGTTKSAFGVINPSPTALAIYIGHWKSVALLLANIQNLNELNLFSKTILHKYKDEITNAFIELLKSNFDAHRPMALDTISEKNALGQLLNQNSIIVSISTFFKKPENNVSVHIQKIINALDALSLIEKQKITL